MYFNIKKIISVVLVFGVLVSGVPKLPALDLSQAICVNAESISNETSVKAITADAQLVGSSSEHITIKTANAFPISGSSDYRYSQLYFEVSGLDLHKDFICELVGKSHSIKNQVEKYSDGTVGVKFYEPVISADSSKYTLRIYEGDMGESNESYEAATGLKYQPVNFEIGMYENIQVGIADVNQLKVVNKNDFRVQFNVNIPDDNSTIDVKKTTVEMLNSEGKVFAIVPKVGNIYVSKNNISNQRYDKFFANSSIVMPYVDVIRFSGDMYAGRELVEGYYDVRINTGEKIFNVKDAIQVTSKDIISLDASPEGVRPPIEGNDDFYGSIFVKGGSISNYSLNLKDLNGNLVASSNEIYRIIDMYENSKRVFFRMSVIKGMSLVANERYKYEVVSKAGKNSFVLEDINSEVHIGESLEIYKHTFIEKPNANLLLKTVNSLSGIEYKFELYKDYDLKIAEQVATSTNGLFNLNFEGIKLVNGSSYLLKVFAKEQDKSGWKEYCECVYYFSTYGFTDDLSYKQPYIYQGKEYILSDDKKLPFEINLLAEKYPENSSYKVELLNVEDESDKIIAGNVVKSTKNISTNGITTNLYVNLTGSFTFEPMKPGKIYKVVVTGLGDPLEVSRVSCLNNTDIFALYGGCDFEENQLNGWFFIIKNGAEINSNKFTVVLSNVIGTSYEVPASSIVYNSASNEGYYNFNVKQMPAMPQGWYFKELRYDGKSVRNVDLSEDLFSKDYPDLYQTRPNVDGWYKDSNTNAFYAVDIYFIDPLKSCELWLYDPTDYENFVPVKIPLVEKASNKYCITSANSSGLDLNKVYNAFIMYESEPIGSFTGGKFMPQEDQATVSNTPTPTNEPTTATVTPTQTNGPTTATVTPTQTNEPTTATVTPTQTNGPTTATVTPTQTNESTTATVTPTQTNGPTTATVTPTQTNESTTATVTPTQTNGPTTATVTPTQTTGPITATVTPTQTTGPTTATVTPTPINEQATVTPTPKNEVTTTVEPTNDVATTTPSTSSTPASTTTSMATSTATNLPGNGSTNNNGSSSGTAMAGTGVANANATVTTTATATAKATPTATPLVTPTATPTSTTNDIPAATDEPKKKVPAVLIVKDLHKHWAKEQVLQLFEKGIISGYEDSTFRPDNSITRAELAVIIAKTLGFKSQAENTSFKDDSGIPKWAKGYVVATVEKGIISGYRDYTFKASRNCTRQELVTMVMKAFELGESSEKLNIKDAGDVQKWAKEYVAKAIELEIIKGYGDNSFKPNKHVTRAESAVIIVKAMNAKKNEG